MGKTARDSHKLGSKETHLSSTFMVTSELIALIVDGNLSFIGFNSGHV
jgi:hypothetical protein